MSVHAPAKTIRLEVQHRKPWYAKHAQSLIQLQFCRQAFCLKIATGLRRILEDLCDHLAGVYSRTVCACVVTFFTHALAGIALDDYFKQLGEEFHSLHKLLQPMHPSVLNSHHPRCSDSTPTSPPSRPANLTVMVNTSLHPSVASVYPLPDNSDFHRPTHPRNR